MLDSSAPKTVLTATHSDTDACATHCSCSDKSAEHARSTAEASPLNTTSLAQEAPSTSSSTCCQNAPSQSSDNCHCGHHGGDAHGESHSVAAAHDDADCGHHSDAAHSARCDCATSSADGDMSNMIDGQCHFDGMTDEAVATEIEERLVSGGVLNGSEALYCMEKLGLECLMELSHRVTAQVASQHVSLCSITNVKSGKCTQDCKWCAQSSHFATGVDIYDVKSKEQCLEEARACYNKGVEMFSLVAGGRKPTKVEFKKLIEIIDYLKANVPIKLCASLGLVDKEQLAALKEHGIERYHCNLETAPSYFDKVVTRHTIEDKIQTLLHARDTGMDLCSGGIIGMGESNQERVELALAVRRLGIKSIPVNVLHPIAGTPLENATRLTDDQVLRSICIFRLVNPDAHLRFAGGRALLSDEAVNKAIYCGINAAIVGDLLTTLGSVIDEDRARFAKHHYNLPDIPSQVASLQA